MKARNLEGMFLITDSMAHKTSAIKETARQYCVPSIEAKMSRLGVIEALRIWVHATDPS